MDYAALNKPRSKDQSDFLNENKLEIVNIAWELRKIVERYDPPKIHKLLSFELERMYAKLLASEITRRKEGKELNTVNFN